METKVKARKKAAVKKKVATQQRIHVVKESMTKSAMVSAIAEETGLTKKAVSTVFDSLTDLISGHIQKGGVGTCTVLGLLKINVERNPSTEMRMGRNPFTGKTMVFDAKPAHAVVKVQPLKALQDMTGLPKKKYQYVSCG